MGKKKQPKEETVRAMKPVRLASVADGITAGLLIELLEKNHIVSLVKEKGSGSYMRIFMGNSIYGQEIYVDEEDYQKAKEIWEEFSEASQQEQENTEDL